MILWKTIYGCLSIFSKFVLHTYQSQKLNFYKSRSRNLLVVMRVQTDIVRYYTITTVLLKMSVAFFKFYLVLMCTACWCPWITVLYTDSFLKILNSSRYVYNLGPRVKKWT